MSEVPLYLQAPARALPTPATTRFRDSLTPLHKSSAALGGGEAGGVAQRQERLGYIHLPPPESVLVRASHPGSTSARLSLACASHDSEAA